MPLSEDLVSLFVKATKDTKKTPSESTVYGTVVMHDDVRYVKIDGSDHLTPVATTTAALDGERVTVLIKDHTATITGNLSSPSARTDDVQDPEGIITQVEILVADKVSTSQLSSELARIDNVYAKEVDVSSRLTAQNAEITELKTKNATIEGTLEAATGDIDNLKTTTLTTESAKATYATIENLDVVNQKVLNLDATYGDINTLIFGTAGGKTIQTEFSNAVIAQLGDAQIKSAMIDEIAASKIRSGEIDSTKVSIKSEDGNLTISDETIQIKDRIRVRVQIGKDAEGDYSINVWDANGKLMFSKGGITADAIKEGIIRNDMVSEDANISASKLDIESLFEVINDSEKTIKSSKIYFDDEAQTLDVVFKSMSTDISGLSESVTSQGTRITAVEGDISSKIWQQDIDTLVDGDIATLKTKHSEIEQTVDGISTIVGEHAVDIQRAQSTAETAQTTASSAETLIQQLSHSISMLVTDGNGTSLMTQTDDGWTFSTAEIQTNVSTIAEGLDALTNELGSTSSSVDVLQQAVNDLGEIAEYVKIGTYEDEPCIELGESDSEFKLRITNTQTLFMEGSSVIAHFSNQSLHIKKAVIEEELQQGEFVWQVRSNGNLGLIWKGVSS